MQTVTRAKAVSLSVSFQSETLGKIDAYCAERGCSRSWFMNRAAKLFLNECLEDKADYEAAAAAWSDYEKSGRKSYSSAELREEFGL